MMIERYKRDLIREFRNYDKMMLMKDLMAGLTVTAVAIPLAEQFITIEIPSATSPVILSETMRQVNWLMAERFILIQVKI